jgi:hypothetical protein
MEPEHNVHGVLAGNSFLGDSSMKIHFLEVTGRVAIDDKTSMQDAVTGMVLDASAKPYLILTGDHGSARLIVESRTISLGPNSFLYTKWSRPGVIRDAHRDIRLLCGRLWAKIDSGAMHEDNIGSAVVGIRG